mmetsp:Transcript_83997/g.242836  ORF Transcript_83997/g.242836 Transcript_83997/m.242836 type:complete len:457 (-) Transcript_83997:55-1425(-)
MAVRFSRYCIVLLLLFSLLSRHEKNVEAKSSAGTGSSTETVPTTAAGGNRRRDSDLLKIVETEVWDEPTRSWKALTGDQRWSNERGMASPAPSEAKPPPDWDFDGEWKIVMSGSDAMGWEYTFQYLQPPTRKRTWLRSLKAKPLSKQAPVATARKRRKGRISRTLADVRDAYNFKGFSCRVYKSLLAWESCGVAIGLPLTSNFDLWDRNPSLPSISSTFGLWFPMTLTASLSASMHVEWLRWFLQTMLLLIPRILLALLYKVALPLLRAAVTAALLPLGLQIPMVPESPKMIVPKPVYNSEISERIGCSLAYRWSRQRGFEWRFNYWHSYLPTFIVIRRLLRMERSAEWWDKHFGSVGLSTGYPLPFPPHYSCSANVGASGLYLKNLLKSKTIVVAEDSDSGSKFSVSSALKETSSSSAAAQSPQPQQQDLPHEHQQQQLLKTKPAKLAVGSKAVS